MRKGFFSARNLFVCAGTVAALAVLAADATTQSTDSSATEMESVQLPVFSSADLVPQWRSERALRADTSTTFPQFELRDQSGRPFTRHDMENRIVVANFFFTGCSSLCPRLRSVMARVRDAYPDDHHLLLLSNSVTPELDDTRVLGAYARINHIDGERWRLLTGTREMMSRVAFRGYLVPKPPQGTAGILHTELFVLLDQHQRVRGFYNGTLALDIQQLIADIATLEGRHPSSILTARGETQ